MYEQIMCIGLPLRVPSSLCVVVEPCPRKSIAIIRQCLLSNLEHGAHEHPQEPAPCRQTATVEPSLGAASKPAV